MSTRRLLLLRVLLQSELALAAKEWQYFCFDSATAFGRISTTTIFSVLPDPGGGKPPATQPPPKEEEEARAKETAAETVDADEPPLTPVQKAARQLKPLEGTCYFMRVGYWTYEVCPWKTVRQYHTETGAAGGAAVHNEFQLGKHQPESDSYFESQSVFVQQYTGGTEGRGATVRYMCSDSWRDEDGVVVVHEPKPKQYVITLRVQALCSPSKRKGDGKSSASEASKHGKSSASEASKQHGKKLTAKEKRHAEKLAKLEAVKRAAAAADGRASARTDGSTASVRGRNLMSDEEAVALATAPPAGPMQIAELVLPNTRLLDSIRGRCFSMVRDYWTYELCPGAQVRQFRQEGSHVGVEFQLGSYDKTLDKVTVGVRGSLDQNLVPHTFAQTYTNGTANRRVQVRVRCSTKNEHSLIAVDEPAMHDYVMVFSSPLGCELSCAYAYAPIEDEGA